LNSDIGGVIYLGVDDQTREPLDVSSQTRHQWEEIISNWAIGAFYPIPYDLIQVLPNEELFTIRVRSGSHQPYAIASQGFDASGVYIREGSSAVKASNERIRRLLQQSRVSSAFDQELAANQALSFQHVQEQFRLLQLEFDEIALHLRRREGYNNSALLISNQNPITVKVAIFQGTDVMMFKDKKEFSGPITQQIDAVLAYLDLINWTRVVITGKSQRVEQRNYPVAAIREAIINAFVHRDYLLHSEVKIEVFDDRIEIMSPGGAPDGLTIRDIRSGYTAARNPTLIHVLDKMEYIENYGTGIKRIYRAYQGAKPQPDINVLDNAFLFTLPNRNYVMSLPSSSTSASAHNKLTANDLRVLAVLGQATAPLRRIDIQNLAGLSRSQVHTVIKHLVDAEKITVLGESTATTYEIRE
jgi:predicted HTH transcriptional regulator